MANLLISVGLEKVCFAQCGVRDWIYCKGPEANMNPEEFRASITEEKPPIGVSAPLAALWWDAKGDWTRSHAMVDELETTDGMAVHAYLHRKEGQASNADYWYQRAGHRFYRPALEAEWQALVEALLSGAGEA
jgi:hypothetical protein